MEPYSEVVPFVLTPELTQKVPGFKRTAFLNAAKKYNADVIVGATVDVTTNSEGLLVITITGYPARYVKFRNATAEDVWMVDLYRLANTDNTAIFGDPVEQKLEVDPALSLIMIPTLSFGQMIQSSTLIVENSKPVRETGTVLVCRSECRTRSGI